MAATIQPSLLSSDGDGRRSMVKKRNIPSQKPFFLKA
jgi:hypothetical protein